MKSITILLKNSLISMQLTRILCINNLYKISNFESINYNQVSLNYFYFV